MKRTATLLFDSQHMLCAFFESCERCNIFRFLSGSVPQPYGDPKVNSQGGEARIVATQTDSEITLSGYGALPGVPTLFALGTERASSPLFGGQLLVGGDLSRFGLGITDANGVYNQTLPLMPSTVAFTLTFQQLYRDTADATGYGLSSAVETVNLP